MVTTPDSIDQLSQVISHVIAPAFMLGAVTSFVSILSYPHRDVLGRIRTLNAIPPDDPHRAHLREDVQRLSRRVVLLRRASCSTLGSGVVTMLLMIASFALAIFGVQHVWSVAILFIVALALFCAAMVILGLDGRSRSTTTTTTDAWRPFPGVAIARTPLPLPRIALSATRQATTGMTPMERATLAPDLTLSRIVYGMWRVMDDLSDPHHVQAKLEACLDHGITTLDMADIYGHYLAESALGGAFRTAPHLRDRVEIVTKCGIVLPGGPVPARVKHYDTSARHIRAAVEASLSKMRIERIDLLLIHRPDPFMDAHETARALEALVAEGKVRALGVSNFAPHDWTLLESALSLPARHEPDRGEPHRPARRSRRPDRLPPGARRPPHGVVARSAAARSSATETPASARRSTTSPAATGRAAPPSRSPG